MKGRAMCLRCDWDGETRGNACPSCGAPLYREGAPPPAGGREKPAEPALGSGEGVGWSDLPTEPGVRSRPVLILGALAAFASFAIAIFLGVFASTAPHASPAARWTPSGALVYATSHSTGQTRLWRWDLASGKYTPGPIVKRVMELVDAKTVAAGAIGVTTRLAGGEAQASVIKLFGLSARPERVLRSHLIAWQAGGHVVVGARPASARRCPRATIIVSDDLSTDTRSDELRVCGEVTSLGRAASSTFFTLKRPTGVSVEYVAYHRPHSLLTRYTLRSVSPRSDLLVTRQGRATLRVGSFGGVQRPIPLPFGMGGQALVADRVLAWSPDASSVLVHGVVGARRGVWLVRVRGTDPSSRPPVAVLGTSEPAWATFAADGTAYVASAGRIFVYRNGGLFVIKPPPGAPAPAGPLVWLG